VLAAGQRLRRRSDFAAAIRAGRRAGRGCVVAHLTEPVPGEATGDLAAPAGALPAARAGFVVSRAVGGAVVRNAVRRRLRHLVGERLAGLRPGSTLVVRALPGAATASYRQLGLDLDAALAAARARARRTAREVP
jgi:ribonuclease P protein component